MPRVYDRTHVFPAAGRVPYAASRIPNSMLAPPVWLRAKKLRIARVSATSDGPSGAAGCSRGWSAAQPVERGSFFQSPAPAGAEDSARHVGLGACAHGRVSFAPPGQDGSTIALHGLRCAREDAV